MFTGLVEEVGECLWLRRTTEGTQLVVNAPRIGREVRTGDSVSVNGCCLTVTSHRKEQITFDLLDETLARTNLGRLRPGSLVNLEQALAANGRLGGHFVQGHVDGVAKVLGLVENGADLEIEIELPFEFAHYMVWKGSIGVSGISLTVSRLTDASFTVSIIPHTRTHTNLSQLTVGDDVNLEFDLLAKYAERILRPTAPAV